MNLERLFLSHKYYSPGLPHISLVREPEIISELSNKGIKQISTGRTHSAALTAATPPTRDSGKLLYQLLQVKTIIINYKLIL